jgi:hypothetical protein
MKDKERMVEQVFRVMLEFGHDFGVPPSGTRRAFRNAERAVGPTPYRPQEAVGYQTLHQIGEILNAWHVEPAYLDERGDPRSLPVAGLKSFATLCHRFLPMVDSREIADMLIAENLLKVDAHGAVTPLSRAARLSSDNALMLDRIPLLLHAFASTLRHNARRTDRSVGTRCEQGTMLDRIPVEAIPEFNDLVKTLGHTLLNQTDTWASRRQVAEGAQTPGRHARVGVEVFAYVEAEPTRRRSRPK